MDREESRRRIKHLVTDINDLQKDLELEKEIYVENFIVYPKGSKVRFYREEHYEGDIRIKGTFTGVVLGFGICKNSFRDYYRVECELLGGKYTVYSDCIKGAV